MDQQHPEQDHAEVEVGPVPAPSPPPTAPQPESHQQEAAAYERRSGSNNRRAKRSSWFSLQSICSIIFSGIVAVATAIYAWNNHSQLDVMRDTLEQIKSTDAKTKQLVEANQGLVTATKNLVTVTSDLVQAAKDTQAESKRQADAALGESKRSLEVSRRAWLIVDEAGFDGGVEASPQQLKAAVRNVGSSPAERLTMVSRRTLTSDTGPPTTGNETPFTAPIGPGDFKFFNATFPQLNADEIGKVESGQVELLVIFVVQYGDQFVSRRPLQTFCFRYHHDTKSMDSCKEASRPK